MAFPERAHNPSVRFRHRARDAATRRATRRFSAWYCVRDALIFAPTERGRETVTMD
jgi:hypothetical protein